MKFILASVACALFSADAQRFGGRGQQAFARPAFARVADRVNTRAAAISLGDAPVAATTQRAQRVGGDGLVEKLDVCLDVLDQECTFSDFEIGELLATLTAIHDEAEAAGTRPVVSDEIKARVGEVKTCLREVLPGLPDDDACKLANEHEGKEGPCRLEQTQATLEACVEEIDFDCGLDFDVLALIDAVSGLVADGEATGDKPEVPAEVRTQLELTRQCLQTIEDSVQEGSPCQVALEEQAEQGPRSRGPQGPRRGGRGGRRG